MGDQRRPRRSAATANSRSEVSRAAHPMTSRHHDIEFDLGGTSAVSDGEALAPLAPSSSEDGAASTGPHPQPEPVRLVASPVVGLECALHRESPGSLRKIAGAGCSTTPSTRGAAHASSVTLRLSVSIRRSPRERHRDRSTVRAGRSLGQTGSLSPARGQPPSLEVGRLDVDSTRRSRPENQPKAGALSVNNP